MTDPFISPLRLTDDMRDRLDSRGDRRLDAYYYAFDSTGNDDIDRILAAVALAGKAYHSTEYWNDDSMVPTGDATYVELIQAAANEAAKASCERIAAKGEDVTR